MQLFIRNLLFTILVPGTVAVYVPVLVLEHPPAAASIAAGFAAIVLLLGAAAYSWCVWDFATAGRGTPAPIDPPTTLVVRGLYRWSRNPMYVGVLCVIAGWALLFRSTTIALYGACVAAAFHLFVLLYEEPHLSRMFGADYRQYCANVSRWLPLRKPRSRRARSATETER